MSRRGGKLLVEHCVPGLDVEVRLGEGGLVVTPSQMFVVFQSSQSLGGKYVCLYLNCHSR
jgi:hypothetical protein